jgi:hypothetical protein
MRGRVIKALAPLHAFAVENPVQPGTPDVNYVEGWIELKWLREWPKGADTPVRFEHYSPQQRIWAIKRRKAGGQVWFLLQCKREWILLDAAIAAMRVNLTTREELIEIASWYSSNGLEAEDLIVCLSQMQNVFSLTEDEERSLKQMLRKGSGLGISPT